jgi:retron-type reverse transcriptase
VDELRVKLQFGGYHHLVEADIKGFFDNLSHQWLMRMLAERLDDEPFVRLIKKWLKAGVLDTDGQVLRPESGTPQGGIISPVLANVYLHYALDLWFERVFQRSCSGGAFLHRYADGFVCGFERAEDAQRFYNEVEERLRTGTGARQNTGSCRSVVIARERRASSFWVSSFAGV